MEEGAAYTFRVPPDTIEFTLLSPRIGVDSLHLVDSFGYHTSTAESRIHAQPRHDPLAGDEHQDAEEAAN
jgi:hypothetical protein